MVFISASLTVRAVRVEPWVTSGSLKKVILRSETSWTKAAICLHIPRSDSEFEAKFWGSLFKWIVLDQGEVLPWRKMWDAAGESFDSSSVLSLLICNMGSCWSSLVVQWLKDWHCHCCGASSLGQTSSCFSNSQN